MDCKYIKADTVLPYSSALEWPLHNCLETNHNTQAKIQKCMGLIDLN